MHFLAKSFAEFHQGFENEGPAGARFGVASGSETTGTRLPILTSMLRKDFLLHDMTSFA